MFWTDLEQASQRLSGTVVNFDGKPFYTNFIDTKTGHKSPFAYGKFYTEEGSKEANISLDDDKWNNFRDLPSLGWRNLVLRNSVLPCFLERKATNTRLHGICDNNSQVFSFEGDDLLNSSRFSIYNALSNKGYLESLKKDYRYPTAKQIITHADPGQGLSFHPKFCIFRDSEGIRWLYRKRTRIGMFPGLNSLMFLPDKTFYEEELRALPNFDIEQVKEF